MNFVPMQVADPQQANPAAQAADFDREQALTRVDGDEDFLRELAGIFRDDCPRSLAAIQAAIDRADYPVVERLAHTLKGAASNFYAKRTVAAAFSLETAAAARNLAEMTTAQQDLVSATKRFLEILDSFLGSAALK
jgi:two-component system, sensor histidine kinase and response regulator